jgi:hypothetical protein
VIPVFGYFHIEASNPIVGLWCDDCSLPSLCEFPLYSVNRDGVGQVGTVKCCVNCNGDEEGEDEDPEGDLVRG